MAMAGGMPSIAVHPRLVHPVEELPRIRRERLDVAPLPLGVDRIEYQRRLARAGHAGDDDQLPERDVEIERAQVVLPRPADADDCRLPVRVMVRRAPGAGGPETRKLPRSGRIADTSPPQRIRDSGRHYAIFVGPDAARGAVLRPVQSSRAVHRRGRRRRRASWSTTTPTRLRRAALIQRIGEVERSADKVTYETVSLLHSTFITPFDRDDIHRLISGMDDILDLMQDAAESMQLFDIQTLPPESRRRWRELLENCCEQGAGGGRAAQLDGQRAARTRALRRRSTASRATPTRSCATASRSCSARSRTCAS